MDCLVKGWFTEFSPDDLLKMKKKEKGETETGKWTDTETDIGEAWPGQAFSLEVEQILHHEKSQYQDVMVFKSRTYGNVLILDGIIQCTERDEHSYQEMLTHLPLFSHPDPKDVLIVGGGDGGVLREVLRHPCVQSVTMCEIDQMVIDVAKKYFPKMSVGFGDPRFTLHVGDGFQFMEEHKNKFDVIITDSSDPLGPAETLFRQPFYERCRAALKVGGICCSQAESIWLHMDLIKHMIDFCQPLFSVVAYASSYVPTYPSGCIGYLLCSKSSDTIFEKPLRILTQKDVDTMGLQFYNSQHHEASFALPEFAKKALSRDSAK